MRNRDGNCSFPFQFCTIVLLCSLGLNASEYLISYKYIVKNAVLFNESLDISRSMQECKGIPTQTLILPATKQKNFVKLISHHHEAFIDYIHQLGLDVQSKDININSQIHSTTIITLKTTCFKVDFNDNFVKISHLKQP